MIETTKIEIKFGTLDHPKIAEFLKEHIEEMQSVSPPESKHALDLAGLKKPDITFWSMWLDVDLVGCGAIRELDEKHGEIKSMRVCATKRGSGLGSVLLEYILKVARSRGYARVSLETGAMPYFEPARCLYKKHGFSVCAPFAGYKPDPNSVFMSLAIQGSG